tara:strand:- start:99 stop:698 length:600 start_codon:yes stop_codon:yes gene_type:complete
MINFFDLSKHTPYIVFRDFYDDALKKKQLNIQAVSISSFNPQTKEVSSRMVNLKYIKGDKWFFYTNYESPKANDFSLNNQIAALFYWDKTNVQIRIKGKVAKASSVESDAHFNKRHKEKNILSIVSNQSQPINSYNDILKKYEDMKFSDNSKIERPPYWGGYFFIPEYFEFWEGKKFRLNKRVSYIRERNNWISNILEP